jgi:hypothetical protein
VPKQEQQQRVQTRPQQTRQPQPPARQPRTQTDEFAKLMRANTVQVSASGAVVRKGRAPKRKSPAVGKIALALSIAAVAVDASAFAVFMGGDGTFAFGICFVVVFLTFIAAVMGFIAAVGGMGRWYGVGGVLIAFAANPVVLIVITVFVAPEMATQFGA